MAKKVVATLKTSAAPTYAKVIVAVKSEKNGAYCFNEELIHTDKVKDALNK